MMKQVELLAPAGNKEAFYGAIKAGANAIYLAGQQFGARAYADNFSNEVLTECIHYAHLFEVKVYLTVNTLVKQQEYPALLEMLEPLYYAGLDGVIVQDVGVIRFIKQHFPLLELHISTQMSLCTEFGAAYLKDFGASRIVPAREISLSEIKAIKSNVDIEIESFIHGAMCYCYSGLCLFSSILGGRSGNRGKCAQPCRLPYSIGGQNGHFLSLRDMCTIDNIPDLISAGIDSFKIEGRMKKAEYAAGTVSVYRKCIDSYYSLREKYGESEAKERYQVDKVSKDILSNLYIRSQIHNGYYYTRNGKEMITVENPAYKETKESLIQELHGKYIEERKKLPVSISGYFMEGEPAIINVYSEDYSVSVTGDRVDTAQNRPISEENVRKQLAKLGDTNFAAENIDITIGDAAFYPLGKINELRRSAIEAYEQGLLLQKEKSIPYTEQPICSKPAQTGSVNDTPYCVSIETREQYNALCNWLSHNPQIVLDTVYVHCDLAVSGLALQKTSQVKSVYVSLPAVFRRRDTAFLDTVRDIVLEKDLFEGVLIHTMDEYGYFYGYKDEMKLRLDHSMYIWSTNALLLYKNNVNRFTLPYELNGRELAALQGHHDSEKIVYARIPMMVTANCLQKTLDKCGRTGNDKTLLKDRYGKSFPVKNYCTHCYNIVYNSVPMVLKKEMEKYRDISYLRLDFTVETYEETSSVLDCMLGDKPLAIKEYTTGHEKRGVE